MNALCQFDQASTMKRCVVGIRRSGDAVNASSGTDIPTVWFPSMATMAAVLSEDNQALLRVIRDAKPKTLTELATLSGRQVPNLSRTLRIMAGYGLVELKRNVREVEPIALATSFKILID
jgi:predicted transcriptional regulator